MHSTDIFKRLQMCFCLEVYVYTIVLFYLITWVHDGVQIIIVSCIRDGQMWRAKMEEIEIGSEI